MSSNDALLVEWNQRYPRPGFCARWNSGPQTLAWSGTWTAFLLKEAYGDPESPQDWDLREYLASDWHRHAMWRTAAHWAHVYQELGNPSVTPYPQIEQARDACEHALFSSAVINLKKAGGRSQSRKPDLLLYVKRDGDLLRRQVDLISPRVLLCGMTWPLTRHLWPFAEPTNAKWVHRVGSMWVVDFWHPALRRDHQQKYGLLDQWLREAGIGG